MKASTKLKKQKDDLERALDNIELTEFFEKIPQQIRERTRAGQGIVEEGGRRKPLKKLKETTITARTYAEERGELSEETSPSTSNLTWTGRLLNSLAVIRKSKRKVELIATGTRKDGLTNQELIGYVERIRKFFGLSSVEKRELDDNLRKAINKAVRSVFK